jgi:hypothetical protein
MMFIHPQSLHKFLSPLKSYVKVIKIVGSSVHCLCTCVEKDSLTTQTHKARMQIKIPPNSLVKIKKNTSIITQINKQRT